MTRNLGNLDRTLRVLGGAALLALGGWAPLDPALRAWALALPGVYVLGTALFGRCLGYGLLGLSSCPLPSGRARDQR